LASARLRAAALTPVWSSFMAASTSMWEYHTARLVMAANWCMPERYSPSSASSTLVRSFVENPLSRPAMAKLPRAGLVEVVDAELQAALR
jgi:hypothetical protein